MKTTLLILLSIFLSVNTIIAQGITNTLGGNTVNDKFIVENSNSEAGLVVTGEGNVGIGTTNPSLDLTVYGEIQSRIALQISHSGTGPYDGLQFIHGNGTNGTSWIVNAEDHPLHLGTWGRNDITITDRQVGIQTSAPGANLDVNGDVILGISGTRFIEIQEITGITGTRSFTSYTDKLPSGWTGAKTRVLSLEIQFNSNNGGWFSTGYSHRPGGVEIACHLIHANRDMTIYYPDLDLFHGRAWRAMIMLMP